MDAVLDAALDFAGAEHPQGLDRAQDQQRAGRSPRLRPAASAVQNLVSIRLE